MLPIIALSGQCASGKDVTCAMLTEILSQKTGLNWVRRAFADPVKDLFCSAFGCDREFVEKWKRVSEAPPGFLKPVRQSLQFIGDGFREIVPGCWIDMAMKDIGTSFCLADGRYRNEAKVVNQKNGLNVVLWRPGYENDDPNPSESQIKIIVDWCKTTNQNGKIDHNKNWSVKCDGENNTPEIIAKNEMAAHVTFHERPEGLENYHYFLRNDGTEEDLYKKVSFELTPFIINFIEENTLINLANADN